MADNSLPQDFHDTNFNFKKFGDISAEAESEKLRKESLNNPYLKNELNKLDQNRDGKVDKDEATEYAKTLKENIAKSPQELKAAIKEAPELTPENAAANFKGRTGKDISPEAAEILAKATREGAASPNPTGNTGGAGNQENGQGSQSKSLPGEKKDEEKAGAKSDIFDHIAKFLTAMLAMVKGLTQEEKDHAQNDMVAKSTAGGGTQLSSNQMADSVRSVTGDRLNDVAKLSPDALEQAKNAGKAVRETGGSVDLQATQSSPSYVAAPVKSQQAAGGYMV